MTSTISYRRHRFPPEIISHAIWLDARFPLSLRLVEVMLLERSIRRAFGLGIGGAIQARIEIAPGNGRQLVVPGNVDPEALARLLVVVDGR